MNSAYFPGPTDAEGSRIIGKSVDCPAGGDEMVKTIKSLTHGLLEKLGFEIRRIQPDDINMVGRCSNLDEQSSIHRYLQQLTPQSKFCVDIGASDGVSMSNAYMLFRDGWEGLAVEYDGQKFPSLAHNYMRLSAVNLARYKVTPLNACALLEGNQVPKEFGFLSLDIDGYDYFVLQQILSKFRPSLICAEINEKIPPPIKFTVKWDPEYAWAVDHFYGQSISQLHLLCTQYQYSMVELHYNNAFLIPEEINSYPSLTPEEAYSKGYLERPDRKEKFPWNANVEKLLGLPPQEAVDFVDKLFLKYEGKFVCSL